MASNFRGCAPSLSRSNNDIQMNTSNPSGGAGSGREGPKPLKTHGTQGAQKKPAAQEGRQPAG